MSLIVCMEDVMLSKYKKYQLILFLCLNSALVGCFENTNSQLTKNNQSVESYEVTSKSQNISLKDKDKQDQKDLSSSKIKEKVLLDAPIISQHPELKNGCEVTSLAMLLNYAGIEADKIKLAEEVKKDDTPLTHDEDGNIEQWGNPNDGFVGDITGEEDGFGVYDKPIADLLDKYMPQRAINLSNQSFNELIKSVNDGKPVIVWITISYEKPKDYKKWKKGDQIIKATFDEHAVLLVGYDHKYCYINDPSSGEKNAKIKKSTFKKLWNKMGKMAVSYA
jgi:uncharacterized protein YvpB